MHHVLERQLKHVFGSYYGRPAGLDEFLKVVSDTYVHFDEDRTLLERSLDLSSKEFRDNTQNLAEAKDSIEKLVAERTQELFREHANFLTIINTVPIGIILLDKDNTVTVSNHSARTILGKDNSSSLAFADIVSALTSVYDFSKKCSEFRENKISVATDDVLLGQRSLHITLVPVDSVGEVASTSIVILIEDTTEHKILEEKK